MVENVIACHNHDSVYSIVGITLGLDLMCMRLFLKLTLNQINSNQCLLFLLYQWLGFMSKNNLHSTEEFHTICSLPSF